MEPFLNKWFSKSNISADINLNNICFSTIFLIPVFISAKIKLTLNPLPGILVGDSLAGKHYLCARNNIKYGKTKTHCIGGS
jgi:hypothetical protein